MLEITLDIVGDAIAGTHVGCRHSETGLTRGLEYDEQVMVRFVGDDRRFLARVDSIQIALEDTHYGLVVDSELTAEDAAWFATVPQGGLDTATVTGLLADLAALQQPLAS